MHSCSKHVMEQSNYSAAFMQLNYICYIYNHLETAEEHIKSRKRRHAYNTWQKKSVKLEEERTDIQQESQQQNN